jgi:hypothetical protein
MKREKRLTKRERRSLNGGPRPQPNAHIHCIACGRHIDPPEFESTPQGATLITCDHGSRFAACTGCESTARYLIEEHDRTGKPVQAAAAYH